MTTLVPPVDLAPSLPSRLVTIHVASPTEGPVDTPQSVTFRLYGDIHVADDQVIVAALEPVTVNLIDGQGQIRLPVWDGRFGGQWAIGVKKSWAPYEYYVRIPAGAGTIDLSQLAPMASMNVAAGSVDGQIGTSGLPAGGAVGDVLTVTPSGLVWASLADAYDETRFQRWEPGARQNLVDTARYEAFPVATQLADGRIVVAWQSNETHYGGPTSTGKVMWSTNGGSTWSTPVEPNPPAANQYWVPVGLRSRGGTLAMLLYTVNPANGLREGWLQKSTNGGSTWTTKTKVDWQSTGTIFPHSLAWLDDGTPNGLMLAPSYGGEGIVITGSSDAGATWTKRSVALPAGQGWSECGITQVGDRVLMLVRNDADRTIAALWSSNWGTSWTTPRTVLTDASGLPLPTVMRDGTILATIRDRAGLAWESWALARSRDGGTTWTKQPVDETWMMYGQILQLANGDGLLVGASNVRGSTTNSDVWARPLVLTPARVVDSAEVDRLRAQLAVPTVWSPVLSVAGGSQITGSGVTITGQWTQIGTLVTVELAMTITTVGSWGTGAVQLTLPVPCYGYLTSEGVSSVTATRILSARRVATFVATFAKPSGDLLGSDLAAGDYLWRITYRAS